MRISLGWWQKTWREIGGALSHLDDALSALPRQARRILCPQAGDSQQQQGLMLSVPYSDNIPVEVVNTDAFAR